MMEWRAARERGFFAAQNRQLQTARQYWHKLRCAKLAPAGMELN